MPAPHEASSLDWRAYYEQRAALIAALPEQAYARAEYADAYHPYPVLLSEDEVATITSIGDALARGVRAVVECYFDDRRIRSRVPLSKRVRRALRRLRSQSYQPGLTRADFLHDVSGAPRVCEINARFVFNGLILSTHANRAFSALYPGHRALAGLDELASVLDARAREPALVIKGREAGYDVHLFLLANPSARFQHLREIESALGEHRGLVILELHQDELTPCLDAVVDYMLAGGTVINEPRTLFIVHDKRLLSVLSNRKIMRDHVDRETAELLTRCVIRTWSTGYHRKRVSVSNAARSTWIAKRAISGKTDGLVLGSRVTKAEWNAATARPDFAIQERLAQWSFPAWEPCFRERRDWHLAGTLPIVDGRSFGPGLYRLFSRDACRFFGLAQPLRA